MFMAYKGVFQLSDEELYKVMQRCKGNEEKRFLFM